MAVMNSIILASGLALVITPVIVRQQPTDPKVPRLSNALVIEAESMVGSAQATGGEVGVQNMQSFGPGWGAGAQLFWGGTQIGAQLRLSFATTVTGRYEIFLHYTKAPDFAAVRAQVDGATPVTFNGYAPTVTRDRALLAMLDLTPGPRALRLEVVMKDGKSAGFNVGLDRIELQPVAGGDASGNRSRDPGTIGDVNAGAAAIPIWHVPPGSTLPDVSPGWTNTQTLPMSARIEITEKALSSTSIGKPARPLRLTPRAPQSGLSYLSVRGEFSGLHDYITIRAKDYVILHFLPVEPGRPHLFDCEFGFVVGGAVVRLSTEDKGQSTTIPLGTAPGQRLTAAIVSSDTGVSVRLELDKGELLNLRACELTPFK